MENSARLAEAADQAARQRRVAAEQFAPDIVEEFDDRIVMVNYHPGSLCCLADGYRVRDGQGGKRPVKTADCVVVGFGDEAEW